MEKNNDPIINDNNGKEIEINQEEKDSEIISDDNTISNNENITYEAKVVKIPDKLKSQNIWTFKIIIVGNSGVGKTSITNNAVRNVFFDSYRANIGMEIFTLFVKVNNKLVKLQIWDTCGQEIYRSLISNFYRNSSLAVIVYSIDKKSSFKDIDLWLKELRLNSSPDIKIILIGNKSDLIGKREVSYDEGAKYLEQDGIIGFYETSAKTGDNIKKIFEEIAIELYKDYKKYKITDISVKSYGSFKTTISSSNMKKSCCWIKDIFININNFWFNEYILFII